MDGATAMTDDVERLSMEDENVSDSEDVDERSPQGNAM